MSIVTTLIDQTWRLKKRSGDLNVKIASLISESSLHKRLFWTGAYFNANSLVHGETSPVHLYGRNETKNVNNGQGWSPEYAVHDINLIGAPTLLFKTFGSQNYIRLPHALKAQKRWLTEYWPDSLYNSSTFFVSFFRTGAVVRFHCKRTKQRQNTPQSIIIFLCNHIVLAETEVIQWPNRCQIPKWSSFCSGSTAD